MYCTHSAIVIATVAILYGLSWWNWTAFIHTPPSATSSLTTHSYHVLPISHPSHPNIHPPSSHHPARLDPRPRIRNIQIAPIAMCAIGAKGAVGRIPTYRQRAILRQWSGDGWSGATIGDPAGGSVPDDKDYVTGWEPGEDVSEVRGECEAD